MKRSTANWLFYTPVAIACFLFVRPHFPEGSEMMDELTDLLGLLMVLLGLVIRVVSRDWKVAHGKDQLVITGPYAIVRNPMYVGSYFIGLGICMVIGELWFVALFTVAYFAVHGIVVKSEESYLSGFWQDEYRNYMATVPAWIPSPSKMIREFKATKRWVSSKRTAMIREINTICTTIAGAIGIEAYEDYVVEGWKHAHTEIMIWLLLVTILVAILVASTTPSFKRKFAV
jgi:protein-S-isoprenylcysteine O-methyltransferase Ste14